MPSQDPSAALPLVHAPDGVGYRLLELPPELVDDHSEWSLTSSADGLARLRAAGRTYALRQKNTSNALVLLAAGAVAVSGDADGATTPAVAAVATLRETVELVEEKEDKAASAATTEATPKPAAAPARGKWHEKFGRTR